MHDYERNFKICSVFLPGVSMDLKGFAKIDSKATCDCTQQSLNVYNINNVGL